MTSPLNNGDKNLMQLDDNTMSSRIKLSRSLKALKSNPKRRHISKDLKQSIDKLFSIQPPLQSVVNLNSGDLRLLSIYGIPPKDNAPNQQKRMSKKAGGKKRREQSTNFPAGQSPLSLPDMNVMNAPHD